MKDCDSNPCAGAVLDHGDGSYTASYTAEASGEVQLVVTSQGGTSKSLFTAQCLPAAVAPAVCVVERGPAQVTAGTTGQLRFLTSDRCGQIPSPCGTCGEFDPKWSQDKADGK